MPRSISLQPGESKTVTMTVQLDKAQLEENAAVFENGFYVDGYVYLTDSMSGNTPLNIPFMGFRGDWGSVPALTYGDVLENFWGYFFYTGLKGYTVQRTLRTLEFALEDETGKECAVYTEEYALKGDAYFEGSIADLFVDTELADGTYTLVIRATPDFDGAETQIIRDGIQVTIDRTAPSILSVRKEKSGDGYTVTVTCDCDDVDYFTVCGATLLNRNFMDIIPVDTYDHQDEKGNYVYVLQLDSSASGQITVEATDRVGMTGEWGTRSPLLWLLDLIQSVIAEVRDWFSMIPYWILLYLLV